MAMDQELQRHMEMWLGFTRLLGGLAALAAAPAASLGQGGSTSSGIRAAVPGSGAAAPVVRSWSGNGPPHHPLL